MLHLLSTEERKDAVCEVCGETRSVKYPVDTYDGEGNPTGQVHMCNACALALGCEPPKATKKTKATEEK